MNCPFKEGQKVFFKRNILELHEICDWGIGHEDIHQAIEAYKNGAIVSRPRNSVRQDQTPTFYMKPYPKANYELFWPVTWFEIRTNSNVEEEE